MTTANNLLAFYDQTNGEFVRVYPNTDATITWTTDILEAGWDQIVWGY